MRVHSFAAKRARSSGGVTLKQAREAAEAVKGDRPRGKFALIASTKSKSLREKYLGEIVHSSTKDASPRRRNAKKK